MHDDQPGLEPIAETARRYTRLGIMVLPSHYPIRIDGPDQHSRRYACSCGRTRCPTPGKHPIGRLTIAHATVNADRVAAWWAETPSANVATPAGRMFDVLQLTYPRPADQLLDWLNAHGIEPGPVIATAPNLLQFPVRGSEPTVARYTPLHSGRLARLGPDTLVLLPPSQHIDGHIITWHRLFTSSQAAPLPDGEQVWDALAHLPPADHLHAWARSPDSNHDGEVQVSQP
jgi:hypothetical protein